MSELEYASVGTRSAKPPLSRRTVWFVLSAMGAGVLLLAAFVLIPREQVNYGQNGAPQWVVSEVVMARPGVTAVLLCAMMAGAISLLTAAVVLLMRKRVLLGILLLLAALGGSFVALLAGGFQEIARYKVYDRITAEGKEYAFIDSSFLMAQTMAIARVDGRSLLTERFTVLGTNNGDWPRSYARVIRPAPVKAVPYGALYLNKAGMLVGLRHDNRAYVAYDLRSGVFHGHNEIEQLSPFVLLDETGPVHQADVTDLRQARAADSTEFGEERMGVAGDAVLREGMEHANPAVRKAAEEILEVEQVEAME